MSVQIPLFGARIRPTRPLRGHPRGAALLHRVTLCLTRFPELDGRLITVGVTRSADGIAVLDPTAPIVRFNVARALPSHYTVGHELTHLLQALSLVPGGEVQCDIWTLARDPVFRDEPPCYLPLPRRLRREWRSVAADVGALCGAAIELRSRHRTYIRWLRGELAALAAEAARGRRPGSVRGRPSC